MQLNGNFVFLCKKKKKEDLFIIGARLYKKAYAFFLHYNKVVWVYLSVYVGYAQ